MEAISLRAHSKTRCRQAESTACSANSHLLEIPYSGHPVEPSPLQTLRSTDGKLLPNLQNSSLDPK